MESLDPHDVIGLGERGVEVAPVEDTRPDRVRARILVEDDLILERLFRVEGATSTSLLAFSPSGSLAAALAAM